MAVASKTVISFGLVEILIAMYTAVQDNDISFNQLHKDDHQRIRYKKVCGHCGKEVGSKDIVNGYRYDKDHYVIVTDEDLEQIKTEYENLQIICQFVLRCPLSQWHPVKKAWDSERSEMFQCPLIGVSVKCPSRAGVYTRSTRGFGS